MMALKPESEEEEREAILASLDSNHNIEVKKPLTDYCLDVYKSISGRRVDLLHH
jgi:hypothetical protein